MKRGLYLFPSRVFPLNLQEISNISIKCTIISWFLQSSILSFSWLVLLILCSRFYSPVNHILVSLSICQQVCGASSQHMANDTPLNFSYKRRTSLFSLFSELKGWGPTYYFFFFFFKMTVTFLLVFLPILSYSVKTV